MYTHLYILLEDIGQIQADVEKIRSDIKQPLSSVVNVALPDGNEISEYMPEVNPWKLEEEIIHILPQFEDLMKSYIFKIMFEEHADRLGDLTHVKFWRSFQRLWREVTFEWDDLCEALIDGSITLTEIERVFDMFRCTSDSGHEYYNFEEIDK